MPSAQTILADSQTDTAAPSASTKRLSSTEGVLLIGADFQALGVARALADRDIPVYLLESEFGIARYSKFVDRWQPKHDLLSDANAVDFLLQLADKESLEGWIVFCVDDETVEFLSINRESLSQEYVLSVPSWDVTKKFYKKDLAYDVARQAGVPAPIIYPSSSLDELLQQTIEYPVVLKPTFKRDYYERTRYKARLVNDRDQLIHEFKAMNEIIDESQILVQEYLIGGTRNLFSFAAVFDGQNVVAGLTAHRRRQHPMDFGRATTYAESCDMPQLEDLSIRILRELNYKGIAEIEFMFDERTGEYKFIEMNGRFWGWHALTQIAGLNFPLALFQVFSGVDVQRQSPRSNARWVRRMTDVPIVFSEAVRGRMSARETATSLLQSTTDAVWSWKDPWPFLMEVAISPYLWWKKGF